MPVIGGTVLGTVAGTLVWLSGAPDADLTTQIIALHICVNTCFAALGTYIAVRFL